MYGIIFKHWRISHWWDKKFTGNATLIVDYRLDATDARRFQNLNFESEKRTNECSCKLCVTAYNVRITHIVSFNQCELLGPVTARLRALAALLPGSCCTTLALGDVGLGFESYLVQATLSVPPVTVTDRPGGLGLSPRLTGALQTRSSRPVTD